MIMNETGNVYGAVLRDYSNLFNRLNKLKNCLKNEFIHGGHLVSIASPALAISTMILLGLNIRLEFLIITYLGTLCIYNYDYIKELKVDYSENVNRSKYIQKNQKFRIVTLIFYVICFLSMLIYFGNLNSIIFGIFLLILGLLYTNIFKKFTKKIAGFKNLYTSISFSMLIIFTPIFYSYQINSIFLVFLIFVLLQFIVDTSFCDMKDLNTDKKNRLKTLPLIFGKLNFLRFITVLNIISFFILSITIILKIMPLFSVVLLPFFIYRIYYINKAKEPKSDIIKLSNLVDAEYLFWPIALFIGSFIITL